MPSPGCCCDCPTKEESGMPDSLIAHHGIVTSASTGMPSDTGIGGGPFDCDPQYNYEFKTDLLQLLGDIIYDYVATGGSGCGACCYHYHNRGGYTPECPESLGPDYILFGNSHFIGKAIGGYYETRIFDGPEAPYPDPSEPYEDDCCPEPTTLDCFTYCGMQGEWLGGVMSVPLAIYGTADLYICVAGNVVTICETINFAIPCKTISGTNGEWITQTGYAQSSTECDDPPTDLSGVTTAGGETEGCGMTGAVLTLTSTGDLTGISGADIWEKIKNAPSDTWVSDYEFVACSCAGGGCAESDVFHKACGITSMCGCLYDTVPDPSDTIVHEDEDVDIDCEYAVGTMRTTFTDE